jgi:hypothetical protein
MLFVFDLLLSLWLLFSPFQVRTLNFCGAQARSAAMMMVGHRSESIYRGLALSDEAALNEGAAKLAAFHELEKTRKDPPLFPRRETSS